MPAALSGAHLHDYFGDLPALRGTQEFHCLGDLAGGASARVRELADLIGHHGKPPSVLPGPGRLDRRVEGEQVGLGGDLLDQVDELGNGFRLSYQRAPCWALSAPPTDIQQGGAGRLHVLW